MELFSAPFYTNVFCWDKLAAVHRLGVKQECPLLFNTFLDCISAEALRGELMVMAE
jgi:hypothetical protein